MTRLLQHPAALLFLCFALVGTPVSYRGGASDAHPHMFLEFMLDAAYGSFAHHHGGGGEPAVESRDSHDGHAHSHADEEPGQGDPESAQPVADLADAFAPTLSAFVVGDVGQLAFILPQNELPLTGDFATAFHPFGRVPAGLSNAPTAPPPR
jgi:hypothetical protein